MEIIKQGIKPTSLIFECTACGCEFKADKDEYRFKSEMQFPYTLSQTTVKYSPAELICYGKTYCPNCDSLCIKEINLQEFTV